MKAKLIENGGGTNLIEKAPGTRTGYTGYGASNLERKALGTVWILCPNYPILTRGLEGFLKGEARVHVGHEPPEDKAPSSIIFCPNGDGDVAAEVKRLRELVPHAPVLIFGLRVDAQVGRVAFRSGVSGYIHAGMAPARIVEVVSLASAGEVVIPKEVLKGLVEEETPGGTNALTSRQREILGLVAEGLTNAEVGRRLYLSEFTIKQHLRHAFKVLKVKNRTEAARLWSGSGGPANSPEA